MRAEDSEIAEYLNYLLKHALQCRSQGCPTCTTMQPVLELVRHRLFASPHYVTTGVVTPVAGAGRTH